MQVINKSTTSKEGKDCTAEAVLRLNLYLILLRQFPYILKNSPVILSKRMEEVVDVDSITLDGLS